MAKSAMSGIRFVPFWTLAVVMLVAPRVVAESAHGIDWRSGAEVGAVVHDAAAVRESLLRLAARDDARHVVVQFKRTPGRAQRADLARSGLHLLSYLGHHAYFAALAEHGLNAASPADAGLITRVEAIRPQWKLDRGLAAGDVPAWAVTRGRNGVAALAVCVVFHRDIALVPDAVAIARRHGAIIRSRLNTVNGLVIELPRADLTQLVSEDAVQWIEPPLPAFSEVNDSNRAITEADVVQGAPYGLSGKGVTVLVYDAGSAMEMHPDYGGRLTSHEVDDLSNHATHVAGTIGGDGASSEGLYRGMAPAVRFESYAFNRSGDPDQIFLYQDPGDIELDYSHAIHVFGADVANNSIGTNTCRNGFDCAITGDYGVTAQVIDSIVAGGLGAPFRIVWANGNERGCSRCVLQGVHTPGGFHSTAPPACAKNQIGVGALNSNDGSVTSFTSWGPCDDGRIKPDISAPGCQSDDDDGVTSCCFVSGSLPRCVGVSSEGGCCDDADGDGFGYRALCGTSMATPTVTGLTALLLEDYRSQFPDRPDPLNSTVKALLAHNARDIANPGPDYQTGFGSVRIQRTVDFLRGGTFVEGHVDPGQSSEFLVRVQRGDSVLKLTLAWDDSPGTPNVGSALVNDLDIIVRDPDGQQHFPWTLEPDTPRMGALRDSADHVNNIEQVYVADPQPGLWSIAVLGFDVPSGAQSFSLCLSPRFSRDCNANGVPDEDELASGSGSDCTRNGILDECEADCNGNGVADSCDIAAGVASDCNSNRIPDDTPCDPFSDCNGNGVNDACDVHEGGSKDCNRNDVPDECEDCNASGFADECDIATDTSVDCNVNGAPDECDLATGDSADCNANGVPDECDTDCNENAVPDDCDIADGSSLDCNGTNIPDECELADQSSADCNANAMLDECDIARGASEDCNADGVPDDCQLDCNQNGVSDTCDIVYGTSMDADANGVPDECLRILRVPSEYDTIQAAINAAAEGDTVLVADGVYTGPGNKELDPAGRNVTIRSENGPAHCVIDCEHFGRAFVFQSGETRHSVVDGFTMIHASTTTGGGVNCLSSSPTIRNCVITDNAAFFYAGGINCERGSPRISGCVITHNSGFFYAGGMMLGLSGAVVENCLIGGNVSTMGATFGDGGGVYLFEDTALLDSCLIVGNEAIDYGGGIYGWGSLATIRNCTVAGNASSRAGGGTSFWRGSAASLSSGILWMNSAPAGSELHAVGSTIDVAYSDVEGGADGARVLFGQIRWMAGNIVLPPGFVDPAGVDGVPETWEDNDYHLLAKSTAVDRGDPALVADSRTDFDGEPRVLGGRIDMGIDEFPADCNGNGLADFQEIYDGTSDDCNDNLIPDDCDLSTGASEDTDNSGVLDECECAFDAVPPRMDHDRMCLGGSDASFPFEQAVVSSGYIDPRRSSFDGKSVQMGLNAVTLVFSESVFNVGSTSGGSVAGVLTAEAFAVVETGDAEANRVTAILLDPEDATRVRVELQRFITRQEWTTISAHVEDACGNAIVNSGNLGPGSLEPDRIDVGFLPGDVDQNGDVEPIDLLRLRRIMNDTFAPACLSAGMLSDVDRDGAVTPLDLERFRQAIVPVWAGRGMHHEQP